MNLKHYTLNILFCTGIAQAALVERNEGSSASLPCDLNVQYPTWTGPSGLADPLITGQTINEEGIKLYKGNLIIIKTSLKHDGNYTCSDDKGNSQTTELDVQYFLPMANLSAASTDNTTSVLTCRCHSNPPCQIFFVTYSYHTPDIVFNKTYPCEPDPTRENRTLCGAVTTIGITKESNGREENQCEFHYKNLGNILTLTPKNTFYFPPTNVNITANKDDKTLTLNCTSDSSNPVALLTWYKGNEDVASNNSIITSNYQPIIADAEYNGKSISQSLDINVDDVKDGEMAFCCAKHLNTDLCTSIQLAPFRESSGGSSLTSWMTLIVVAVSTVII